MNKNFVSFGLGMIVSTVIVILVYITRPIEIIECDEIVYDFEDNRDTYCIINNQANKCDMYFRGKITDKCGIKK